jgi:hypothetical protein
MSFSRQRVLFVACSSSKGWLADPFGKDHLDFCFDWIELPFHSIRLETTACPEGFNNPNTHEPIAIRSN